MIQRRLRFSSAAATSRCKIAGNWGHYDDLRRHGYSWRGLKRLLNTGSPGHQRLNSVSPRREHTSVFSGSINLPLDFPSRDCLHRRAGFPYLPARLHQPTAHQASKHIAQLKITQTYSRRHTQNQRQYFSSGKFQNATRNGCDQPRSRGLEVVLSKPVI